MDMVAVAPGASDELIDENGQAKLKFRGGLVEVHGLADPVQVIDKNADSQSPGNELVDVNGLTGRAFWMKTKGKYLVHLRNDLFVDIAEENLREWVPPASEEGGFDHLWPSSDAGLPPFGQDIAKTLAQKGWCLVEYISNARARKAALEQVRGLAGFHGPKRELVADYLGHGGSGKIAFLPEWVPDPESGGQSVKELSQLSSKIETLSAEMAAHAGDMADAISGERRPTLAWLPFENREEMQRLRGGPLSEEDLDAGVLEEHLNFIRHRRLGFMFLVENDGGDLLLSPREDIAELRPVRLPLSPSKLLIYRADWMTFSYKPRISRRSFVLQTWLMEEAPEMDINNLVGSTELRSRALGINNGIPQPVGDQIHCMSMAGRISGRCDTFEKQFSLFFSGTDSFAKIPLKRWDMDLYSCDVIDKVPGKTYAIHAGCTEDNHNFDNEFFKLDPIVVKQMSVGQFELLEEGYMCLHSSGYTKKTLKGMNLGIYIGDCGADTAGFGYLNVNQDVDLDYRHPDHMRYLMSGQVKSITASRLSFHMQMRGPCQDVDTACSASLVAVTVADKALRQTSEKQGQISAGTHLTETMPMGINNCNVPWAFIGLSAAGMSSKQGRCFTFDQTADGYARGEACIAMHMKISNNDGDTQRQMACLLGSKANQDGRSANLTAPNGPAQQAIIRETMREAGLSPDQINTAECHGTGTALGDPIELGALKNVMEPRAWPLLTSSAKSNVGHGEAAAGILGLGKCIHMLNFNLSSPNCHLCELNPNIDNSGFPIFFCTEPTTMDLNAAIAGVSSFGMGGTNSRGDLWGQTSKGPNTTERVRINLKDLGSCVLQVTCPVTLGPIDYLTGEPIAALAPQGTESVSARRRRSDVLRDPGAPYDISRYAYPGGFRYRLEESMDGFDEDLVEGNNVRICGSWSGWRHLQELEPVGGGWYSVVAAIGESRCESFFLCLGNNRKYQRIYPVVTDSSGLIHIEGPDSHAEGRKWMIDGRDMEVPAGTFYEIRFRWGHLAKRVYWTPLSMEPEHTLPHFEHTYAVVGSFNSWTFQDMHPVPGKAGTWEAVGRIGPSGQEEFRFIRDHDWDQAIYPAWPRTENPSVPVRGPDHMGEGKGWLIRSDPNSLFRFKLQIVDGQVQVDVHVEGQGPPRTWQSLQGWDRHHYYVIGSWNNWEPMPMVMDFQEAGLFRCRITLDPLTLQDDKQDGYFQIIVDKDRKQAWYPREGNAFSGKQITCGPEEGSADGRCWMVKVPRDGAVYEIILDLAVTDRRRTVTWWYESPLRLL